MDLLGNDNLASRNGIALSQVNDSIVLLEKSDMWVGLPFVPDPSADPTS